MREAIELRRYGEADREIARLARAIKNEATLLDGLAAEMERVAKPR